jgi:lambda family phage portal protein
VKFFDSIAKRFGYVKPQRRSFKAAAASRLLSDWQKSPSSADAVLKYDLKTLRSRARDLEANNDYVRKFLSILENNILGPKGVELEMRTKDRNGDLDRQANDIIETAWRNWSRARNCTVTRSQTWLDVQRLVLRSVARDGACLIVKAAGFRNDYGFALQVLESDHLDHDYNVSRMDNGNEVRFGVELNAQRAPVAYYLLERHEGDNAAIGRVQRRRRVPAEDILHVYRADRAEQTTGTPWFASSMARLHQLDGYMEAEVVAARIASCKMGFYTQQRGDELTGYEDAEGNNLLMDVEPGAFEQLPAGVDFKSFDPQHPVSAFDSFVKANLRGVASGMGISYNNLAGDLESVNYSSLRQAALDERDQFQKIQAWFVDHVSVPVFESWLESVLLNGSIGLPAARFAKFNAPEFRPRRWSWVDPLKDINAARIALENGLKSRRQVIRENGGSVEDVVESLAADKKLYEDAGLNVGGVETNEELTSDE